MALLSCPMCLSSPTLTLLDLSGAVSRFAAASATAAIRCPVCNAATSGLSGLAAHLAAHQREEEEELRQGRGRLRVKVEAGARDNGNTDGDVFTALNLETAIDPGTQKEHGASRPPPADDLDELLRDFSEIIGDEDGTTTPAAAAAAAATVTMASPTVAEEWERRAPESPAMKMELPFFTQPPPPPRPPSPPPPLTAPSTSSTQYHHGLEPSLSQNHLSPSQPEPQTAASVAYFPAAEPNSSGAFAVRHTTSASPHQNQMIQCSLCGWNFDNENFLQLHQALMHSLRNEGYLNPSSGCGNSSVRRRFFCRHCKEQFSSSCALEEYKAHLHAAHNDHRFVCPSCGKLFKLRGSLLVHERIVHNPAAVGSHTCSACGAAFNNKYRRDFHERRHQVAGGMFRCLRCGRNFGAKCDLEKHVKGAACPGRQRTTAATSPTAAASTAFAPSTSSASARHLCNVCADTFETKAELILHSVRHIKEQHRSPAAPGISSLLQQTPIPLSEIKREDAFPASENNLSRNVAVISSPTPRGSPPQIRLPENDDSFCVQCQAPMSGCAHVAGGGALATAAAAAPSPSLATAPPPSPSATASPPLSSSSSQKQWQCDICLKTFTTKYFLKKHNRLHTGETPYACHLCGRAFTFQQSYHKHMLYHTDEKPYTCSTCGRSFKELSTLQNHERIHSGERPFACESCGKSFRQRVSYLVHRRIHTGVMPYSCAACGKHFRYKVTQRTHKCIAAAQESHSLSPDEQQQQLLPTLPPNIQEELRNFRKVKRPKIPHCPDHINDSPLSELGQLSLTESCSTSQEKCNKDETNPFADFML